MKVLNKGKRCFILDNNVKLFSGKMLELSKAEAEKLIKLYPEEIETIETAQTPFKEVEEVDSEEKEVSKMKVAELKEILEAARIEIPEDAKKADLVALVEGLDAQENA